MSVHVIIIYITLTRLGLDSKLKLNMCGVSIPHEVINIGDVGEVFKLYSVTHTHNMHIITTLILFQKSNKLTLTTLLS